MGIRTGIRATTDLQALGFHQPSSKACRATLADGLTQAFDRRDAEFGDYRTEPDPAAPGPDEGNAS